MLHRHVTTIAPDDEDDGAHRGSRRRCHDIATTNVNYDDGSYAGGSSNNNIDGEG